MLLCIIDRRRCFILVSRVKSSGVKIRVSLNSNNKKKRNTLLSPFRLSENEHIFGVFSFFTFISFSCYWWLVRVTLVVA